MRGGSISFARTFWWVISPLPNWKKRFAPAVRSWSWSVGYQQRYTRDLTAIDHWLIDDGLDLIRNEIYLVPYPHLHRGKCCPVLPIRVLMQYMMLRVCLASAVAMCPGLTLNSVTAWSIQRSRFKGLHDAGHQFKCVVSNNRECSNPFTERYPFSPSHPPCNIQKRKSSNRPISLESFIVFNSSALGLFSILLFVLCCFISRT